MSHASEGGRNDKVASGVTVPKASGTQRIADNGRHTSSAEGSLEISNDPLLRGSINTTGNMTPVIPSNVRSSGDGLTDTTKPLLRPQVQPPLRRTAGPVASVDRERQVHSDAEALQPVSELNHNREESSAPTWQRDTPRIAHGQSSSSTLAPARPPPGAMYMVPTQRAVGVLGSTNDGGIAAIITSRIPLHVSDTESSLDQSREGENLDGRTDGRSQHLLAPPPPPSSEMYAVGKVSSGTTNSSAAANDASSDSTAPAAGLKRTGSLSFLPLRLSSVVYHGLDEFTSDSDAHAAVSTPLASAQLAHDPAAVSNCDGVIGVPHSSYNRRPSDQSHADSSQSNSTTDFLGSSRIAAEDDSVLQSTHNEVPQLTLPSISGVYVLDDIGKLVNDSVNTVPVSDNLGHGDGSVTQNDGHFHVPTHQRGNNDSPVCSDGQQHASFEAVSSTRSTVALLPAVTSARSRTSHDGSGSHSARSARQRNPSAAATALAEAAAVLAATGGHDGIWTASCEIETQPALEPASAEPRPASHHIVAKTHPIDVLPREGAQSPRSPRISGDTALSTERASTLMQPTSMSSSIVAPLAAQRITALELSATADPLTGNTVSSDCGDQGADDGACKDSQGDSYFEHLACGTAVSSRESMLHVGAGKDSGDLQLPPPGTRANAGISSASVRNESNERLSPKQSTSESFSATYNTEAFRASELASADDTPPAVAAVTLVSSEYSSDATLGVSCESNDATETDVRASTSRDGVRTADVPLLPSMADETIPGDRRNATPSSFFGGPAVMYSTTTLRVAASSTASASAFFGDAPGDTSTSGGLSSCAAPISEGAHVSSDVETSNGHSANLVHRTEIDPSSYVQRRSFVEPRDMTTFFGATEAGDSAKIFASRRASFTLGAAGPPLRGSYDGNSDSLLVHNVEPSAATFFGSAGSIIEQRHAIPTVEPLLVDRSRLYDAESDTRAGMTMRPPLPLDNTHWERSSGDTRAQSFFSSHSTANTLDELHTKPQTAMPHVVEHASPFSQSAELFRSALVDSSTVQGAPIAMTFFSGGDTRADNFATAHARVESSVMATSIQQVQRLSQAYDSTSGSLTTIFRVQNGQALNPETRHGVNGYSATDLTAAPWTGMTSSSEIDSGSGTSAAYLSAEARPEWMPPQHVEDSSTQMWEGAALQSGAPVHVASSSDNEGASEANHYRQVPVPTTAFACSNEFSAPSLAPATDATPWDFFAGAHGEQFPSATLSVEAPISPPIEDGMAHEAGVYNRTAWAGPPPAEQPREENRAPTANVVVSSASQVVQTLQQPRAAWGTDTLATSEMFLQSVQPFDQVHASQFASGHEDVAATTSISDAAATHSSWPWMDQVHSRATSHPAHTGAVAAFGTGVLHSSSVVTAYGADLSTECAATDASTTTGSLVYPAAPMHSSPFTSASGESLISGKELAAFGATAHASDAHVRRLRPHAIASFGFGGRLVIVHGSSPLKVTPSDAGAAGGGRDAYSSLGEAWVKSKCGPVTLRCVSTLLRSTPFYRALSMWPGPLLATNPSAVRVVAALNALAEVDDHEVAEYETEPRLAGSVGTSNPRSDARLLMRVLVMLVEHHGTLGRARTFVPTKGQPIDAVTSSVVRALLDASLHSSSPSDGTSTSSADASWRDHPDVARALQEVTSRDASGALYDSTDAFARVEEALLTGDKSAALDAAIQGNAWPAAILISFAVSSETFAATVASYASAGLPAGSPLATLFRSFAGDATGAVRSPLKLSSDTSVPHDPQGASSQLGESVTSKLAAAHAAKAVASAYMRSWRRHAAALVIYRQSPPADIAVLVELGDRVWLEGGSVRGAHALYFIAVGCSAMDAAMAAGAATRLVLPGVDHRPSVDDMAAGMGLSHSALMRGLVAGVQRAEAVEFARHSSNAQQVFIPALAPYKLAYAAALADVGLLKRSSAYVAHLRAVVADTSSAGGARMRAALAPAQLVELEALEARLRGSGRADADDNSAGGAWSSVGGAAGQLAARIGEGAASAAAHVVVGALSGLKRIFSRSGNAVDAAAASASSSTSSTPQRAQGSSSAGSSATNAARTSQPTSRRGSRDDGGNDSAAMANTAAQGSGVALGNSSLLGSLSSSLSLRGLFRPRTTEDGRPVYEAKLGSDVAGELQPFFDSTLGRWVFPGDANDEGTTSGSTSDVPPPLAFAQGPPPTGTAREPLMLHGMAAPPGAMAVVGQDGGRGNTYGQSHEPTAGGDHHHHHHDHHHHHHHHPPPHHQHHHLHHHHHHHHQQHI